MESKKIFLVGWTLSLFLVGAGCSSAPATTSNQKAPAIESPAAALPQNNPPAGAPAAPGVTVKSNSDVKMIGFSFQPPAVTIKVNSTVTWTNSEQAPHTVTADDGSFDSGTLSPYGGNFKHLFSRPGTFTYHCSIHPSMHGTVTVTE